MSKEELKVKPVSSEVANDDLKKVHGGWESTPECTSGVPDGEGGWVTNDNCYSDD